MIFRTSLVLVSAFALLGGSALAADVMQASPAPQASAAPQTSAPQGGTTAAVPQAAKDTIDAASKAQCDAAKDPTDAKLDAAFGYLSKDYVSESFKGEKKSHDEVVSQGKQQLKSIHVTECEAKIDSESAQPDGSVVVTTTVVASGDLQAPDGKHDLNVKSRSQDTWKLVDGKWMTTYGKDLSNLVKLDGNVVQDEGN